MQLLTPYSRREEGMNDLRHPGERSVAARTKILCTAAFGPLITGYAVVVALFALVTAIASVATFSVTGVLRAAGPGLLAAYQVPVTIAGSPLGVLPLLGTAAVCALVATSAARAANRLGYRHPGQAVNVVAPMAAVHALAGVTIAITVSGSGVSVEPLAAFLVPGFVAALAAAAGIADRCGIVAAVREYLDPIALRGLRAGALGLAGLFAVGAAVFVLSMVFSGGTARDLFAANSPGFGSGVGMLLLSVGYLPNAITGSLAFTVGTGFSIGRVSVTPFSFDGGAVPGLPLLAGIPDHAARWWPMLMVLPAAVGALVGWFLRRCDGDPRARLRTVAIAGALVGFGCVLLSTLAGGRLGGGSFTPISIPAGLTSVAAFGWIVVPGGLVAWLTGPGRRAVVAAPEVHDDPADEGEEPETDEETLADADADAEPDEDAVLDEDTLADADTELDEDSETDEDSEPDEESPADDDVPAHDEPPADDDEAPETADDPREPEDEEPSPDTERRTG
ncbi:hypothetical protein HFP15_41960 [Amycolatopsis sp. K13G38]|uniref:AAA family ATPase n=1 Tax=Amycolatopsis acididurans TaxID=2724524 RepID=A0ABX1JJ88_9PSEU|nr:DUF6350 family protein [Amycolatopsis acididurans]NKQ59419.1 hypothetical protein [Amycolatopsis acididurans]